jgi:hypothetical protein
MTLYQVRGAAMALIGSAPVNLPSALCTLFCSPEVR